MNPLEQFHAEPYQAHNAARLAHVKRLLGVLSLDPKHKSVLDLGAGVGDHSAFWQSLGAEVTAVEARPENVLELERLVPGVKTITADLESAQALDLGVFDIVYAYGLIYHLADPRSSLDLMARSCGGVLLLETCVSYGERAELNPLNEPAESVSQAFSGTGCRPTRHWVFEALSQRFAHVYQPTFQPDHPEFATDWSVPTPGSGPLWRTTFVASHKPIEADRLEPRVLMVQTTG
ncbi:MAG: class I SAM-dependent methyltransferase [Beijerinckiaceae bacterium]|nr:class I SAM-dependent methyltransferase [Beijerinckiaceae bacterium]